jgi:hypothetical protein
MADEPMKRCDKLRGHIAFIGEYEFYATTGRVYKAEKPRRFVDEYRAGQLVTSEKHSALALRMARLTAGEPEWPQKTPNKNW